MELRSDLFSGPSFSTRLALGLAGVVSSPAADPRMLLAAASISKSFAGVRALKRVSFDLRPGEVHALVGENGAGKSTLIKVITGAEVPDAGTLAVHGRTYPAMDPGLSRALGIAAIYQQPSLFPDLSVAENIALALETGGLWRQLDWPSRARRASDLLTRVGASIDPGRLVASLSMPEQQLVEVAKAIGADAKIVIMDEPTAALTDREVERLFHVIGVLKAHGVGIIYISHRLEEVFAIADRITVLRDGETVETCAREGVDRASLIRMMVGRELSAVFPKRAVKLGEVALEVEGVSHRATGLADISFSVRQGEILGLAGLVGSGRTQLAEVLFGLTPADSGQIRVRGRAVRLTAPRQAIDAGIAYVPEDRRQHGVVLEMSVASNTSLATLSDGLEPRAHRSWPRSGAGRALRRSVPDQDAVGGGGRWYAIWREPTEGGAGAVALDQAIDPDSRRADTGRRRWFEGRNTRTDADAGRAWPRDRHDFVRAAGSARHERQNSGHACRARPRHPRSR